MINDIVLFFQFSTAFNKCFSSEIKHTFIKIINAKGVLGGNTTVVEITFDRIILMEIVVQITFNQILLIEVVALEITFDTIFLIEVVNIIWVECIVEEVEEVGVTGADLAPLPRPTYKKF